MESQAGTGTLQYPANFFFLILLALPGLLS